MIVKGAPRVSTCAWRAHRERLNTQYPAQPQFPAAAPALPEKITERRIENRQSLEAIVRCQIQGGRSLQLLQYRQCALGEIESSVIKSYRYRLMRKRAVLQLANATFKRHNRVV